ncbi:hypothetical protein [Saccharothrix obliqua]|uniref:hypothetical protein n=1 Tax=Saccharothrix obliqua TaxID=2861747 RepID=UPI001C5EE5C9|nr:hypothetical protein [Saccharothrix obliqua]MBW4720467.1 hypothetical protein [Saccharothrix obliqua]
MNTHQTNKRNSGPAKGLLWAVLLLTAAGNATGSFIGVGETPRMILGGVAVLCIVLLVVLAVRDRN